MKRIPYGQSLAFDRASVRVEDRDGRLHVSLTHISKATVNPYIGKEIPEFEALGLDPDKVYQLLRDPGELERAAHTFNNLPILDRHIRVTAAEHHPDKVVGSTGTDAVFTAPYLNNSLVVWTNDAIELIESEEKKELSSAYYYRADMTPGEYEGVKYDGVMRDIVGNHVALVENGRAGNDVVVGDSMENIMKLKAMTHTGLLVRGALTAHLRPVLAMDAKIDLGPILDGLTAKNFKTKKAGIVTALTAAVEGKLAQDAAVGDVTALLDALEKNEVKEGLDEDPAIQPVKKAPAKDNEQTDIVDTDVDAADDANSKLKEFLAGKLSPEDMQAVVAMLSGGAEDEFPPKKDAAVEKDDSKPAKDAESAAKKEEPKVVTKAAMDAAIKIAAKDATNAAIKTQREIHAAEEAVKPYVGNGMAEDAACAADVYKNALMAMDINIEDVTDPNAYRHILTAQPLPGKGADSKKKPVIAQDAANKDFASRFPGVSLPGVA